MQKMLSENRGHFIPLGSSMHETSYEIGLVGTYPPPFGGVSTHIKALGNFLEEREIGCIYYNTGKTKNIDRRGVINVMSLKDLFVNLASTRADLLHVHGGVELYKKLIILFMLRLVAGKKYIITVHSGGIIEDLEKKSALARKVISLLFRRAEIIICVSQRIKNTFIDLGIAEHKCPVIPAFAINESLENVSLPTDLEAFIQGHRPLLSCLGFCFAPYYGFELAIEAVNVLRRRFPDIGLVIMGGNKETEDFVNLKVKFKDQDLARVFFAGDIQHKLVLSVIGQSEIFLRPTFHDGDSVSVREAIAMGIPVIASDTELRPAEAILFKKGDLHDLTEKILANLQTRDRRPARPGKIVDLKNLEAVLDIYNRLLAT